MMDEEKPVEVEFDFEKVNKLLDVVHGTVHLPNLLSLNQAAMLTLVVMAKEVEKEMAEKLAEAKKKAEEKAAAKAKEEADQRKREEEKQDAQRYSAGIRPGSSQATSTPSYERRS